MERYRLLLSALVGVMLGIGFFTFHFAEGLSYFSNDPNACANCHIMQDYIDSWLKSTHHTRAVCNDCHMPSNPVSKLVTKAENGWNHSVKFTLQTFREPIRIRTANATRVQENCVKCHEGLVHDVRLVTARADAAELTCVRCHAGVGHGPTR